MVQVDLWDLELLCHPFVHLFLLLQVVPLAPCGLFSCASGQALDPWVQCLPVDPEGQAGPCPLAPLSFPVLLGALGPQELLGGRINQGDKGYQDFFLSSPDVACHCCWPVQEPGWLTVCFPALVLAAADYFSCS